MCFVSITDVRIRTEVCHRRGLMCGQNSSMCSSRSKKPRYYLKKGTRFAFRSNSRHGSLLYDTQMLVPEAMVEASKHSAAILALISIISI